MVTGEGNLISASKESRRFSVTTSTVCAIYFFTIILHDGRLISLKFYQHVNPIDIPTYCFLQGFWNHKYIVCVCVCVHTWVWAFINAACFPPQPLLDKECEVWADERDWILLSWEARLISAMANLVWSRKTHLCVTLLVSQQSDYNYFVILHQACLFNIIICTSRVIFCINYPCQSINWCFTEVCRVYDSEIINVTIESTHSRTRSNGWK